MIHPFGGTARVSVTRAAETGLYSDDYEHDACGVAFVARLDAHRGTRRSSVRCRRSRTWSTGARRVPMRTRATAPASCSSSPDAFFRAVLDEPSARAGRYGVAMCFLPSTQARRGELEEHLVSPRRGGRPAIRCWRDVPVDLAFVGVNAGAAAPVIRQLVVAAGDAMPGDQDAFERKLYVIRRRFELECGAEAVVPSFSSRTIVYKGMLTATQLRGYFPDLRDERTETALALVHSRFSTNTFPSWELAHPYRMIAHNGEINTIRGNMNWMRARESQLASELFGDDLEKVLPVVQSGGSDSATLDNVLELLVLGGRSLPHAIMMMIPEATAGRADLPPELLGFYAYHQCMMEAWDGPAAVSFTDGRVIGATLDRNGLRPGRWLETRDGWVVLASEAGVLDIPAADVLRKGRLQPGKLFLVDLEQGRIVPDAEVKHAISTQQPYAEWFDREVVELADLPARRPQTAPTESLRQRQVAFGYTQEDMKVTLAPLARNAEEAVSSMGNDTPLAVLSDGNRLLYSYFKQLFAQVTNPPIDSIREAIVMSLSASIGSEKNLFDETPEHARQLVLETPILLDAELEQLRQVHSAIFKARTLDTTWPVSEGPSGLDAALERLSHEADAALAAGTNILILSDRAVGAERAPVPALLAVAAVHHHLVREGTRLQAGLVAETGEARSVHSIATLIGYGAAAVNPYLMLETLAELVELGLLPDGMTAEQAQQRAVKGIGKGILKTLSKMGISTIPSYCGAQIFEAVGLSPELVDRHFTGTASRIGGHRHRADRARDARASRPRLSGRHRHALAGDRPLRLAPGRRAPSVEPGDDRAAPGCRAQRRASRRTRPMPAPSTTTRCGG